MRYENLFHPLTWSNLATSYRFMKFLGVLNSRKNVTMAKSSTACLVSSVAAAAEAAEAAERGGVWLPGRDSGIGIRMPNHLIYFFRRLMEQCRTKCET